jgi:hypothetical protein
MIMIIGLRAEDRFGQAAGTIERAGARTEDASAR